MPQSLSQIYLHLVFSTKDRWPFLHDRLVRNEVHKILGGLCNKHECPVLIVGGVADHLHILCRFGRTVTLADLIKALKRGSSIWIKSNENPTKDFHWQNGYGAISIIPAHVDALRSYIADQEEHHAKESFQDEFRRILTKYDLEWDERYVWD